MAAVRTLLIVTLVAAAVAARGVRAAAADGSCPARVEPDARVDCAFPGITEAECLDRKCCWGTGQPSAVPQCYYPTSGVPIKTVHVIEACHLDVGFKEMAHDIVNLYFDTHFPHAIQWAAQLRKAGGPQQLRFMTQSYLVSLFMNCPEGMQLHCPNASYVQEFTAAVQRGDIYWHAFPFNAEPEVMSPLEVAFGVQMTHDIDKAFGQAPKVTMSQRDVPGMTRSILPVLHKQGVLAVSVGVNTASQPPNVPRIFNWRDPVSNVTMPSMWHPKGYGGINVTDAVLVPGSSHAAVFFWNGDNDGPPTIDMIYAAWAQLAEEFPGAEIVASTLDNFTQHILPHTAGLPEITSEIGDTWVYGVPSDPVKVVQMRAMNRARTRCLTAGSCSTADARVYNMSRLFVKSAEHTWGEDVKTWLHDTTNWTNADFDAVKDTAQNFVTIQQSWLEQRNWGVNFPLQALGNSPLAGDIRREFAAATPVQPLPASPSSGFRRVTARNPSFTAGHYALAVDSATGAVDSLVHTPSGRQLANASHALAGLEYRTYDWANYNAFWGDYFDVHPTPPWAPKDFGKPGFNVSDPQDKLWLPAVQDIWVRSTPTGGAPTDGRQAAPPTSLTVLVHSVFDAQAVTKYGAPAAVWTNITVTGDTITFAVLVFNKTATRLPESMFVRFNPAVAPVSKSSPSDGAVTGWAMDKLGEYVAPTDVQNGAAKHLHGLHSGLRYTDAPTSAVVQPGRALHRGHRDADTPAGLYLDTLDAPVVAWTPAAHPSAFPTPCTGPTSVADGAAFVLWDNLWGTNYVMWWPFLDGAQASVAYRFTLQYVAP